jgi:DNA-binding beta-propeller fold protein YncE
MTDSKECKNIVTSEYAIQTFCGKFLIGIEDHSIFRYNLETKQKFRIAGSVGQWGYQDGTRDESIFYYPSSLVFSKDLKTLFVADSFNHVIRAICVENGLTTTFAGHVNKRGQVDGSKEKARLSHPTTLKLSPDGNTLFVSEDYTLRTICIATGQVDTIDRFGNSLWYFSFLQNGKYVIICHWTHAIKYNLETGKYKLIWEYCCVGCDFSKDGQLLFIANYENRCIQVVNLVTNELIDAISMSIKPTNISIAINGKQLIVCNDMNKKIQVLDISKYCTNFKTFIQLQLFKHSFLPRQVIRFN